MSDDLNDEQMVLASAYLDGDVTSDERAQVDGDPQLLAEVERLRSVSSSLADTPGVAISTRERHLAAALGAWDRLSDAERSGDNSDSIPAVAADPAAAAGAATVTAPTPLADRRNKRSGQRSGQRSGWMLTAAAVLLVVAGGGLIARGIIDSGSDDSTASESAPLPAQREELSDAAADEIFANDEAAADEAPLDVSADLAAEAESAIASTTGSSDEVEIIDSPERLAEFAERELEFEKSRQSDGDLESASAAPEQAAEEASAAEEPASGEGVDAPTAAFDDSGASNSTILTQADFTCELVDRIIGEAEYGDGLFPKPVAIGVNADETEVVAFRVDTCEVVARAPLGG